MVTWNILFYWCSLVFKEINLLMFRFHTCNHDIIRIMYLRTIKDIVNLLRQIQVNPRLKNLGFDQRGFFHLIVLVQLPCLVLIGKHDCTTAKKASRDIAYSSIYPTYWTVNSLVVLCCRSQWCRKKTLPLGKFGLWTELGLVQLMLVLNINVRELWPVSIHSPLVQHPS